MSSKKIANQHHATFESIKQTDAQGNDFWHARPLARVLDHSEYRHFLPVIERAREACRNSNQPVADHFEDILEMVCYRLIAVAAGFTSALDHGQEMTVFGMIQYPGQGTRMPEIIALRIGLFDAFKRGVVLIGNFLTAHDDLLMIRRLGQGGDWEDN